MDAWAILVENLIQYRDISSSIRQILIQYEVECETLITQIKELTFEDSNSIFDRLYDIQNKLAIVLYKYEFNLNDYLSKFVYHFDRDDITSRQYWYNRFKNGLLWPDNC